MLYPYKAYPEYVTLSFLCMVDTEIGVDAMQICLKTSSDRISFNHKIFISQSSCVAYYQTQQCRSQHKFDSHHKCEIYFFAAWTSKYIRLMPDMDNAPL